MQDTRIAKAALVGVSAAAGVVATLAVRALTKYKKPKIWEACSSGGKFSSTNHPTSGARKEQKLQVGKHPYQLYSMGTPNGVKVTVLLEELGVEYDAWFVSIGGDQFGSDFVSLNPNSKIPTMNDRSVSPPIRLFESGSILMHLAEKHGQFISKDPAKRAECINWLMWQMSSAPYLGGGFGHFFSYAPYPMEYPINRFSMETKRQLDVLDKHLATNTYMCGDEYSIADMAIWPWYGALVLDRLYSAAEFLQVASYTHLQRWAKLLDQRPAVRRGRLVNRGWGPENQKLKERHSAADFDGLVYTDGKPL